MDLHVLAVALNRNTKETTRLMVVSFLVFEARPFQFVLRSW